MQNLGILDNQFIITRKIAYLEDRNVYLARNNQAQVNHFIVIKKHENNEDNNFPANEINILNILHNVNNPYILVFIRDGNGILTLNNKPPRNVNYLLFESVNNFSLFDYIKLGRLTERQAKLLFRKILNGVQTIHNAHICHRDINPENIFLDEFYNPKICNFSLSCINAKNLTHSVGTKGYKAPEMIEFHPYDGFRADIFSLGQLLFALVNSSLGFKSSHANDHYYSYIIKNELDIYWKMLAKKNINPSEEFKQLFIRMVAYDPHKRPTIAQILDSPWMQEINNLNNNELVALENEIRNELHNREPQINNNIQDNDDE